MQTNTAQLIAALQLCVKALSVNSLSQLDEQALADARQAAREALDANLGLAD